MEIGTGKYDHLCRHACGEAGAMAAILIIFDGEQGSGFSVQAPWEMVTDMPKILRSLAARIEEDLVGITVCEHALSEHRASPLYPRS
jgi:hypothetical protein